MARFSLLVILCFVTGLYGAQTTYAQSSGSLEAKIATVYGPYQSQLTYEQLAWINNCLGRCSVSEQPYADGETLKNLSAVSLNKKFVSTLEYDTSYNEATFNPLKYNINFFNKKDQYFRIFNTNYVLKIKKKE